MVSIYRQKRMPREEVLSETEKINGYLEKCAWMDFDYGNIGEEKIVLYGCPDQSWRENCLEIIFEFPQFISSRLNWSMGEAKPFIRLISQETLSEYTDLLSEEGCYIFMLQDDSPKGAATFISAAGIRCNILKPLSPLLR